MDAHTPTPKDKVVFTLTLAGLIGGTVCLLVCLSVLVVRSVIGLIPEKELVSRSPFSLRSQLLDLVIFGGLICLIAIGPLYRIMRTLKNSSEFDQTGVTTQGTVICRWSTMESAFHGWNRGGPIWKEKYHMLYQFEVMSSNPNSPDIITQEEVVSKAWYDILKSGDKIEVQYLPNNPLKSRIVSILNLQFEKKQ